VGKIKSPGGDSAELRLCDGVEQRPSSSRPTASTGRQTHFQFLVVTQSNSGSPTCAAIIWARL